MSALRRCGAPKKTTGTCQRVLDASDVCPTHGQRPAEATDQPQSGATRRVSAGSGAVRSDVADRLDRAAALEAQGAPTDDIAAQLGVSASTIRDYRQRPEYREAVRQMRADMVDAVVGQTSAVASSAVQRLAAIVGDPKTPPAVAVRASVGLLDQLVKLSTFAQLEARVSELEGLLAKGGDDAW